MPASRWLPKGGRPVADASDGRRRGLHAGLPPATAGIARARSVRGGGTVDSDQWPVVSGQWSVAGGQWSVPSKGVLSPIVIPSPALAGRGIPRSREDCAPSGALIPSHHKNHNSFWPVDSDRQGHLVSAVRVTGPRPDHPEAWRIQHGPSPTSHASKDGVDVRRVQHGKMERRKQAGQLRPAGPLGRTSVPASTNPATAPVMPAARPAWRDSIDERCSGAIGTQPISVMPSASSAKIPSSTGFPDSNSVTAFLPP
jgi:hypothetical protein